MNVKLNFVLVKLMLLLMLAMFNGPILAAQPNSAIVVGSFFPINTYRRGTSADDSKWVCLCSHQTGVRRLPNGYFPSFFNEKVCSSDTSCLSGYGKCRQKFISLPIKDSFGKSMNINIRSGCECEVFENSILHSLVSK
jgi:hypothetical protein